MLSHLPQIYKCLIVLIACAVFSLNTQAQWVLINESGGTPDVSAALELRDTTKGLLVPRLTQNQIDSIASPADGLLVYNSDSSTFSYYNGSSWRLISVGADSSRGLPGVLSIDRNAGGDSIQNVGSLSIGTDTVMGRLLIYDSTSVVPVNIYGDSSSVGNKIVLLARAAGSSTSTSSIALEGQALGKSITSVGVRGTNNSTSGITYGVQAQNFGGADTAYGLFSQANGTGDINYGLYSLASGGTNNYSGYFAGAPVIISSSLGIVQMIHKSSCI